ncbi:MAG: hypothetical protein Q9187_005192, partial [Circinaria calcarea]
MSKYTEEKIQEKAEDDNEPDEWDKRIFSTGCAVTVEQTKMNDCYFEKKDWRICRQERATWQLQISRTTRSFCVSFTAALPHRTKRRQLHSQSTDPIRPSRHDFPQPRVSRHNQSRTAFTSTKVYQAQQAQQTQQVSPSQVRPRPPYAATSKLPQPTTGASLPSQNTPPPTPNTNLPDLTSGLSDQPIILDEGTRQVDWARSFHGLSTEAFSKEAAEILLQPISNEDIEVKPDGVLYLPEIKYRRILNKAFGPGGWGLAPRSETIVTAKAVTREYALVVLGRLVSVSRGEQDYFSPDGIPTATEGCKSNALMRCCKDLGIASELWDPRFVRRFMAKEAREAFVEHAVTKKRKKVWLRKDDE